MPFCPDKADIFAQLPLLLPPGRAFQTSDQGLKAGSSNIRQFFSAISDEVWRMDREICSTFAEFFCSSATTDLDLWLDEYGLPDKCDAFADNLCAKVATIGQEGGDLNFLKDIALKFGWAATLTWLKGDHPDYPGIRNSLLVEIEGAGGSGPVLEIMDFENWVIGESAFGDVTGSTDINSLICTYERILPAHYGIFLRDVTA